MIPAPHELVLRRRTKGPLTPHGTARVSYSPPEAFAAHALAPGSDEARQAGRDTSEAEWTVYYPAAGPDIGAHDLVNVGGVEYEARGASKSWGISPWGSDVGGKIVELVRREG